MRERLDGTSRRKLLGQCSSGLEGRYNYEFKKGWGLGKGSFPVQGWSLQLAFVRAHSVPALCNLCVCPCKTREREWVHSASGSQFSWLALGKGWEMLLTGTRKLSFLYGKLHELQSSVRVNGSPESSAWLRFWYNESLGLGKLEKGSRARGQYERNSMPAWRWKEKKAGSTKNGTSHCEPL